MLACCFAVIFAPMIGCASWKCHRPEYYERTGSEKMMETVGSTNLTAGLSVYSTTA